MTDTVTLDIDWPKETEKGKWLLYLTNISATGVEHIQCSPKEEINFLNLVSGMRLSMVRWSAPEEVKVNVTVGFAFMSVLRN